MKQFETTKTLTYFDSCMYDLISEMSRIKAGSSPVAHNSCFANVSRRPRPPVSFVAMLPICTYGRPVAPVIVAGAVPSVSQLLPVPCTRVEARRGTGQWSPATGAR